MRKRKVNFKELVINNKLQIKEDMKEMERIEARIDEKHSKKLILS